MGLTTDAKKAFIIPKRNLEVPYFLANKASVLSLIREFKRKFISIPSHVNSIRIRPLGVILAY